MATLSVNVFCRTKGWRSPSQNFSYCAESVAPGSELQKIGVVATGTATFTLPDGTVGEFAYGIARFEVMGEMKESRIFFGPEGSESVLGLNALQSIGFAVDPETRSFSRISGN